MDETVGVSIVKLTNHKAIWGYIHRNPRATIPQISNAVGLSLPTVTRAVDYGVENGIIIEREMVGGERGRKAQTYSLCPDYMHFILIVVVKGHLYWKVHDFLSVTVAEGDADIDDSNILSTIDSVIDKCIAADGKIAMVAISATGIIDNGKIVRSFFYPSISGIPLEEYIEKRTGKAGVVENDMRVAASAVLNLEKEAQNGISVIFYFGEKGCGAGVLIDGKVLEGAGGAAAEMDGVASSTPDESHLDYYVQKLKSLIYILNPQKVYLYYNGGDISAQMLMQATNEEVWQHLLPEFAVREDIVSDFFCGLSMLCEQKVIESLKKELF